MPKRSVRTATIRDLDALQRLEKVFASDAFTREQLRHLLSQAHGNTFVVKEKGQILGAAVMLWRSTSTVGRLYSLVVDPDAQGRGLGAELLQVCEEAAVKYGCDRISLEVRADNTRAIGFYQRRGYRITESLSGYYEDGVNGLRMVKALEHVEKTGVRLEVPYYAQTLGFTCGPACLMMAMNYFDPGLVCNRSLELMLWKEATLIFMTSGLGGCGPFGLAAAALRRGYGVRVILSDRETPFLSSVRSKEKKDVISLVHDQLREEALAAGASESCGNFAFEDIARAVRREEVPIVLVSTYRLHRVKGPHWVVVTGFDDRNVYFHDPYEGFYVGQARHVRIPISEFRRMRRYGQALHKCVVFIERARSVERPSKGKAKTRKEPAWTGIG